MTMAEAEAYMNEIDEIMEGIDLNNPPTKDAAKEAIKRLEGLHIKYMNKAAPDAPQGQPQDASI